MRTQDFVRAAAGVLATAVFASGAAFAQSTAPQPPTMTDTAPMPASERNSMGAVILMDQPVLAQREAMAARAEVDTRTLGAGPARVREATQQELQLQKAFEEAQKRRGLR